ncbi:MAG: retropepsin-like aspartic protease [bacterium]|nr:retropepsin-like aspartic protease [bacterium]
MTSLFRRGLLACAFLAFAGSPGFAAEALGVHTPMYFQIVEIQGEVFNLMVDTGATATVLMKKDIDRIPVKHALSPVHTKLANGTRMDMMVYVVPQMRIGGCLLTDVRVLEAPPETTRGLLGMQVLVQLEPFGFDRGILSVTCPTK